MDLEPDRHVSLADEPAAFADAVIRLHANADLWTQRSADGRARIEALLGPEAARAALSELLSRLAGPLWLGTEASITAYLHTHAAADDARLVVPVPATSGSAGAGRGADHRRDPRARLRRARDPGYRSGADRSAAATSIASRAGADGRVVALTGEIGGAVGQPLSSCLRMTRLSPAPSWGARSGDRRRRHRGGGGRRRA